ncbi:MAG: nucleotidyltransferase [Sneathiella sp.]|nr:nucleotidyltransferase [Sneathiella sp.]
MGIPEQQLETWSHQGSMKQSAATYKSIKAALEAVNAAYNGRNYQVFLQGSYGNDTNIYSESDVDVIISLDDVYYSDLSELSPEEKALYDQARVPGTYTFDQYKNEVFNALSYRFGSDVRLGNKAITIDANGGRRKADIIPAMQFRRYYSFKSIDDNQRDEGICFFSAAEEKIVNYPRQHSANLTSKHRSSDLWLKPMVRILKNIRSHLLENGLIVPEVAPSYFIEGLLYNVPDEKFGSSYQDSLYNVMNWFETEADKGELVCANEQYYLLRSGSSNCWEAKNAEIFINACIDLWNNW